MLNDSFTTERQKPGALAQARKENENESDDNKDNVILEDASGAKKEELLSEEAREQAKLFKRLNSNKKPSIILICSKLLPCFCCCINRSAQIVQGNYPPSPGSEAKRRHSSKRSSLRKVRAATSSEGNGDLSVKSQQTSENSNSCKNVLQTVENSASPLREAPAPVVSDDPETGARKSVSKDPSFSLTQSQQTPNRRFREKRPTMLQRITSSIAESLTDFAKARDEDLNDEEGVEPEFNKDTNKFKTLGDNYTDRMALVLRLGAGGDEQSHVQTPRSIKAIESTSQYDAHSTNLVPHLEYENRKEKALNKFSSYTS